MENILNLEFLMKKVFFKSLTSGLWKLSICLICIAANNLNNKEDLEINCIPIAFMIQFYFYSESVFLLSFMKC